MLDFADDCVAALVEAFPIEDVWLLEAKAAKECELDSPINLIVIVSDDSEAHIRRASRSRGSSGLSVKLWVPTAEDVLQIVVKDFGPCL